MKLPLFPAKISLALFVLLVAGACLGWLGQSRFDRAQGAGETLAVTVAAAGLSERLSRGAILTACNLRGYFENGDKSSLDAAKRELAAAMGALHDLSPMAKTALAPGPGTSGARAMPVPGGAKKDAEPSLMEKAASLLDAYKRQAELTLDANQGLSEPGKDFGDAARAYADAVAAGVTIARGKLDIGLGMTYPPLEKVRLRRAQLGILGKAAGLGSRILEICGQARLARDKTLWRGLAGYFAEIGKVLDQYANTGLEEESSALAAMRDAAAAYEAKTKTLIEARQAAFDAGDKLVRDERAMLAAVAAVASRTRENADALAGDMAGDLAWDGRIMKAATLIFALFGLVWIALAATALSAPVVKCSRFARELAKGNAQAVLTVGGRGDVGALAEALREIAGRLGRD